MENLQEFEKLLDLVKMLNLLIPEGSEETLEVNDNKVTLNKKDGVINIISESNKVFNDSVIKKIVQEFKEDVQELDDCLFVEIVEDASEVMDIRKFDKLLNQDSYTENDAYEVNEMLTKFEEIVHEHLEDKIQDLLKLRDKF